MLVLLSTYFQAAAAKGVAPQTLCDQVSGKFKVSESVLQLSSVWGTFELYDAEKVSLNCPLIFSSLYLIVCVCMHCLALHIR